MVTVRNLSTDECITYGDGTIPSEAVTYAYLGSIGEKNTWTYNRRYQELYTRLTWGNKTVAMGDFCAIR